MRSFRTSKETRPPINFSFPPWQSTSRTELTSCLASPLDLPRDNNWLIFWPGKRIKLYLIEGYLSFAKRVPNTSRGESLSPTAEPIHLAPKYFLMKNCKNSSAVSVVDYSSKCQLRTSHWCYLHKISLSNLGLPWYGFIYVFFLP